MRRHVMELTCDGCGVRAAIELAGKIEGRLHFALDPNESLQQLGWMSLRATPYHVEDFCPACSVSRRPDREAHL